MCTLEIYYDINIAVSNTVCLQNNTVFDVKRKLSRRNLLGVGKFQKAYEENDLPLKVLNVTRMKNLILCALL